MGQGFHRGFSAAEKTELWDCWKRGESLKAIGRAFGKPSSSTKPGHKIYPILQLLNRELGKTILMLTHDPAAARYAQRTLHLDKGQFVEQELAA